LHYLVTTGWLGRLLRALDDPKVGLVGPCSNRVSGEQQVEPFGRHLFGKQTRVHDTLKLRVR
jgi:hypothetical protein